MKAVFRTKALAIFWKDVVSEFRTRDTLASVLVFSLLVIVVFNFTFESGSPEFALIAPGVLWVTFTFAGVLSLNRSFAREKEKGCLEGLMASPVDRVAIYVGKMLGCLVFMLAVEVVVVPVFGILFDLPLFPARLALIALLATVGFAAVGTVFAALAVHTRARDIMLPLLFFPIVVPVMIAAVEASAVAYAGGPWSEMASWLAIIGAFDAIFLAVSSLVFEHILEE